jgi:hypothetical protein
MCRITKGDAEQIQRCMGSRFEKEKECQRGNFENEKHEAVI